MADHLGSVHFAGALTRRDPAATPGVDPDDVLEDCLVVNSALQASAVNEAFANVGMISPTRNWRLPHLVSKARASSSRDNIARRPSTCTLCPARVVFPRWSLRCLSQIKLVRCHVDNMRFQRCSSRGGSPGPWSRAIKSSNHRDSFPSPGTRVDCKGLIQLQTCGW